MTFIELPLQYEAFDKNSKDLEILKLTESCLSTAAQLAAEQRFRDAEERIIEAMRTAREFSNYEHNEFRTLLCSILFALAELHFEMKDYKQSEKDLETLFRLLAILTKEDAERYGKFNIMAMEFSTRIIRSRRKTLDLLAKQQITTGLLYDKVNAGVASATDKLVESLRKVAKLLTATNEYEKALKFYAEAIRYSKKRSGRVTVKEIEMTIEMAEVMNHVRRMRPRAKRLLEAVLPHAIASKEIKLEEDILALIEIIDNDLTQPSRWKSFLRTVSTTSKTHANKTISLLTKKINGNGDNDLHWAKEAKDEIDREVKKKTTKPKKK